MNRKFVVLGHTGFLGRALMRGLEARGDCDVLGFSSATLNLQRRESLAALDGVVDARTVLVLSAALTPDRCKTIDDCCHNIAMAANVASYLESHAVEKLVYVSTDGIYPMVAQPVTEETPVDPDNFYSLSKFTSERLLDAVARSKAIPFLAVRPTGIYGPGDTHNSYGPNRFVRSIISERVVRLFGEGEERRDHIHVDDAARLIVRLVEAGAVGPYNFATGNSVSFAELVALLKEMSPFEFEVISSPRKTPITHRVFDLSRLRKTCPDFRFTDLREGLRATLNAALREKKS